MGKFQFMLVVIIMALSANGPAVSAESVDVNVNVIAMIESNGDPLAYNALEDACGAHQIRQCVIDDYNTFGPGRARPLVLRDVFNPIISDVVADWYANRRIPAMLKHFGYPDTIPTRLIAYNAGIKYARPGTLVPSTTIRYIEKYKMLVRTFSL